MPPDAHIVLLAQAAQVPDEGAHLLLYAGVARADRRVVQPRRPTRSRQHPLGGHARSRLLAQQADRGRSQVGRHGAPAHACGASRRARGEVRDDCPRRVWLRSVRKPARDGSEDIRRGVGERRVPWSLLDGRLRHPRVQRIGLWECGRVCEGVRSATGRALPSAAY